MYIRVVYTAKIGKDRETREVGIHTNSNGDMNLTFDKDIDWGEPVFMILEPAEALDVEPMAVDKPTWEGSYTKKCWAEINAQHKMEEELFRHYTGKKVEAESKRHVTNNTTFDELMKKGNVE